ncbi:hypothetical protein F0562_033426 [Nyssa sinensis]|uniref:Uncharacterized protein n=1 Tax=Nyssa sinensis TaxID=561372 RepID=A0A5J5AH60_9ASTE|nr:hypothetical protein F0562_033426 [Nyssa sinensis]
MFTLFSEICSSEADVVTINDCPENIMGILVLYGSERRLLKEKASGEKWYWRRERDSWPDLANAASDGENMVADEELEIKQQRNFNIQFGKQNVLAGKKGTREPFGFDDSGRVSYELFGSAA